MFTYFYANIQKILQQIALTVHVPGEIKVIPYISLAAFGRGFTWQADYLISQTQIN